MLYLLLRLLFFRRDALIIRVQLFYIIEWCFLRLTSSHVLSFKGLLCDLLWSDPDKDVQGWGENDRGVSFTFGADVVSKFLNRHDLDLICRAHQVWLMLLLLLKTSPRLAASLLLISRIYLKLTLHCVTFRTKKYFLIKRL